MATDFRSDHDYPRRGRELVGGYAWLARAFDKGRAAKQGTIADYIYPCPIDRAVFARWGVEADAFDAALNDCTTDAQIVAWLDARVAPTAREAANAYVLVDRKHNLDKQDIEEGIAPDLSTLAGRIAARRAAADGDLDRAQKNVQDRHFAELLRTVHARDIPQPGDPAPPFGLLGRGTVVLHFIQGTWSPECRLELEALAEIAPALRAAGTTLIVTSPETPARLGAFIAKTGLPLQLVTDPGCAAAQRYGLAVEVPADLQAIYRDTFGADPTAVLPIPARFVIDSSGTIVSAVVNPMPHQRPEPADLL
jgi:peroxiredoxin